MSNELRDLYPDPPHSVAAGMNEAAGAYVEPGVVKKEETKPEEEEDASKLKATAPNSHTSAKDPQGW